MLGDVFEVGGAVDAQIGALGESTGVAVDVLVGAALPGVGPTVGDLGGPVADHDPLVNEPMGAPSGITVRLSPAPTAPKCLLFTSRDVVDLWLPIPWLPGAF